MLMLTNKLTNGTLFTIMLLNNNKESEHFQLMSRTRLVQIKM